MIDTETEHFVPYKEKETHWADSSFKPLIPNVATVLPGDLPDPFLQLLLLRMQLEEAQYKFEHIDEETKYVIWQENSIDLTMWHGKVADAAKSRAKELLVNEINFIQNEINKYSPVFLPQPPPR